MTARLLTLSVVALASMASVPAWATCTVQPPPTLRDLDWCLRQGDPDIVVKEGEHFAAKLDLPGGTVLRADPEAVTKPLIRTSSPGLVDWLRAFLNNAETDYVTDEYPTFIVQDNAAPVVVRGLAFAPLTVNSSGVDITVGRAFQVHDADLTLEDCAMVAGEEEPFVVRSDLTPDNRPDLSGGLLAQVTGASELRLERVEVSGIVAPEVEGAAVFASGGDTKVEIVGGTYHDSVVGYGLIAASGSAGVYVVVEGADDIASFSELRGRLGGALYAAEGGVVEIYGGIFQDNGHLDLGQATIRGGAGAHAAADRGGSLKIWDGEYSRGNAAFGGVAAVRNASLYVYGGNLGGSGRSQNTARVGGLFAIFSDPTVAGGTPFARLVGVDLIGGMAARNPAEEDAFSVGDESGETPNDGRYGVVGGGLAAFGANVELEDVRIEDAVALGGIGGGLFGLNSTTQVVGGGVGGNQAEAGGGLAVGGGSLSLAGVDIRSNGWGETTLGGGVLSEGAALSISEGTFFEDNQADTGGGLYVGGAVDVTVNQAQFLSNRADTGAAIASRVRALTVFGGQLDDNIAAGSGGAIAAFGDYDDDAARVPAEVRLTEVGLTNNQATWAGAVLADDVDLVVQACDLVENDAVEVGGGIIVNAAEGRTARIEANTELLGNTAGDVGGAIHAQGVDLVIERSHLLYNEAPYASAVSVRGGPAAFTTNRICGNRATQRGVIVLSTNESDRSVFRHNLVDEPLASDTLVFGGGGLDVGHNHFRPADTPAITVLSGFAGFHDNVIAFGEDAPLLARSEEGGWKLSDNVFWGDGQAPTQVAVEVAVQGELTWEAVGTLDPTEGFVLADPRLRAWSDDQSPSVDCAFVDHQPRPDSPLLTRYETGMEFDPDDLHGGIWGGDDASLHPSPAWTQDRDVDAVAQIFDCDDGDLDVLDRLVQYEDLDGDGVGGLPAQGYPCRLEPGHVELGGDCDDADPTVQADCAADPVTFYGTRCSSSGVHSVGGLWLAVLAFGLRRRRFAPRS